MVDGRPVICRAVDEKNRSTVSELEEVGCYMRAAKAHPPPLVSEGRSIDG